MRGGRLSGDQAEITFSDLFAEQLADLNMSEREDVLVDVVRLCEDPGGKHPLSRALAGWNTVDVLRGDQRVVYRVSIEGQVATIEVLCMGPRRANEVYDIAKALVAAGVLTADELTQLWAALSFLEVIAEEIGLDGWDYRPSPAPDGMVKSAVAAGLLDEQTATLLSKDEIEAAMADGWDEQGQPNPAQAVRAALSRARDSIDAIPGRVLAQRAGERCGAFMPRARAACIRRDQHPGPHRSH